MRVHQGAEKAAATRQRREEVSKMMRDKTKKKPKKSDAPIYDEPEGFSIPSKTPCNDPSRSA